MKSLTRTIIVFVIINLTTGNFVLAQNATEEPVRPRLDRRGAPISPEPTPPTAASPEPVPEPRPALEPESAPTPMPAPTVQMPTVTISGRTGVGGVEIQGLPGNPVTDENGFYSVTIPYGFSGTFRPVKKGYTFEPASINIRKITKNQQHYFTAKRLSPAPTFARTGSREVLVIPSTDIGAENLLSITEDLQVMSHIFDERFKEGQEIQGIFLDFGDFFGRDSRSTEAIYIQNYGVIFLMEVNFAFSPAPKPQGQEAKETEEYVDPDWQRVKRKLFSPPGYGGTLVPEEQYSAQQIDQIKKELIRTLKHAANIRNLHPDEWIILTVIGQARQPGEFYEDYFRITAPRPISPSRRRSERSSSSSRGSYGGGMMGGMSSMGEMGGSVMMGGGMGGMAGRGMGGQAFGGGVMMGGGMGGMMGGMEYGAMGSSSATVLTIRAKKSDVDDFAKGELDFEHFQQKAEIFTY